MTTKFEEKLYEAGQKVALTFDEREALRARLLTAIDHSSKPALSPYSPMFYWRHISVYIKPQYVSIALLFVLVAGGVSVAAEKALPGEPLYQVKTSVNENVASLFAFTPQSKAQFHTYLAVRRLEEVETLAIDGRLNASTTANAESKIDGSLAVIKDSVKQLASENKDSAAADTSLKAESSLKVHEAILSTLSDGSDSINASVKGVAISVGIQTTALSLDRVAIDSKSSSTTPSLDVLLDQQKKAEEAIAGLQGALATSTPSSTALLIDSADTTLVATSTASSTATAAFIKKVQDDLQSASDFLKQGINKLNEKAYGEAFVLFNKSEKAALQGQLLLKLGVEGADKLYQIYSSSDSSAATATSTVSSTSFSIASSSPDA